MTDSVDTTNTSEISCVDICLQDLQVGSTEEASSIEACPQELEIDEDDEENRFVCGICGRKFSRGNNLTNHYMTHTMKGKPHVCKICDKSFTQLRYLRSHAHHHKEKPVFKCIFCERTFMMESHRINHYYYSHPGENTGYYDRRKLGMKS